MDDDDSVFTVEKILGKRMRKKRVQYLIKWEGYGEEENSWEDEANIFCKDLIEEFEKRSLQSHGSAAATDEASNRSAGQESKDNNNSTQLLEHHQTEEKKRLDKKRLLDFNVQNTHQPKEHDNNSVTSLKRSKSSQEERRSSPIPQIKDISDEVVTVGTGKKPPLSESIVNSSSTTVQSTGSVLNNTNHYTNHNTNGRVTSSTTTNTTSTKQPSNTTSQSPSSSLFMSKKRELFAKYEPKPNDFIFPPAEQWESLVSHVITVERDNESGVLYIHLAWKDNTFSTHKNTEANLNCPQVLLRFYEKHLRFKQA